jgi:hypothetical protein
LSDETTFYGVTMIEVAAKLYIGDVVEMRKVHPCGGYVWEIVRVGADIGLVCRTCGRRVLLPRREFARGVKRFVQRAGPPETGGTGGNSTL